MAELERAQREDPNGQQLRFVESQQTLKKLFETNQAMLKWDALFAVCHEYSPGKNSKKN